MVRARVMTPSGDEGTARLAEAVATGLRRGGVFAHVHAVVSPRATGSWPNAGFGSTADDDELIVVGTRASAPDHATFEAVLWPSVPPLAGMPQTDDVMLVLPATLSRADLRGHEITWARRWGESLAACARAYVATRGVGRLPGTEPSPPGGVPREMSSGPTQRDVRPCPASRESESIPS